MSTNRSTNRKPRSKAKAPAPIVACAADFRRAREAQTLTLPSGLTVRVRRVDPVEVAVGAAGLHNPLIARLAAGENIDMAPAEQVEHMADLIQMTDVVCCAALVEPRMVMEDGTDEVLVPSDMDVTDRMAVMQAAFGAVEELARFREQSAGDVAPVEPGADVEVPAE